jgi:hypothetical protein
MRSKTEKTIIWGLHVTPEQKKRWKFLAMLRRTPVSYLINGILNDWWSLHEDLILAEADPYKLKRVLTQTPDQDFGPSAPAINYILDPDLAFLEGTRMNLSVRGVSAQTRSYLKALSVSTGEPIYRLIDEMVARAWNEQGDQPVTREGNSRGLRKTIQKILPKYAKSQNKPRRISQD